MVVSRRRPSCGSSRPRTRTPRLQAAHQPVPATNLTGFLAGQDAAANAAFSAGEQAVHLIPVAETKAAQWTQLMTSEAKYANSRCRQRRRSRPWTTASAAFLGAVDRRGSAAYADSSRCCPCQQTIAALTIKAPIAGIVQLGGAARASSQGPVRCSEPAAAGVQGQAAQLLGGSGSGDATASSTTSLGTPVNSGTTLATITDGSTLTPRAPTSTRPTCCSSGMG